MANRKSLVRASSFKRAVPPREAENSWCSSQNWVTPGRAIRANAAALGGAQSVSRIGSQITKQTQLGCVSRNASSAEAPRRHVVQVGEKSAITRGLACAASNICPNGFAS